MTIEVICIRGDGDKELNEISNELIVNTAMAVKVGTLAIDEVWYRTKTIEFLAPFKKTGSGASLMDNDIISISDNNFGIFGNKRIKSIKISGSATDLSVSLSLRSYEEP